ncbi:hypothetical protein [Okeania sp. SIO3B5]|nr:hypothetical protein [Okeania sp. SIO3B5]
MAAERQEIIITKNHQPMAKLISAKLQTKRLAPLFCSPKRIYSNPK